MAVMVFLFLFVGFIYLVDWTDRITDQWACRLTDSQIEGKQQLIQSIHDFSRITITNTIKTD